MFIIASIKPMEHCLVPFLNECDANDDHTIDLVEWGTCLGIADGKYGEINIIDYKTLCHYLFEDYMCRNM